jgi:predicted lipoprotein with Yx(FWY)xxD motif
MQFTILTAAGVAAVAISAASASACGSSPSSSVPSSTPSSAAASASGQAASGQTGSGGSLQVATISSITVVTNARGFTLYWFAPDTATTSKCTGACAQIWPPVPGPATAGSGVTGMLATITRPDGSTQATYDGHPLYTYTADTAPGQANGNGLNVDGGVWHEVTESGATAPAANPGAGNGY